MAAPASAEALEEALEQGEAARSEIVEDADASLLNVAAAEVEPATNHQSAAAEPSSAAIGWSGLINLVARVQSAARVIAEGFGGISAPAAEAEAAAVVASIAADDTTEAEAAAVAAAIEADEAESSRAAEAEMAAAAAAAGLVNTAVAAVMAALEAEALEAEALAQAQLVSTLVANAVAAALANVVDEAAAATEAVDHVDEIGAQQPAVTIASPPSEAPLSRATSGQTNAALNLRALRLRYMFGRRFEIRQRVDAAINSRVRMPTPHCQPPLLWWFSQLPTLVSTLGPPVQSQCHLICTVAIPSHSFIARHSAYLWRRAHRRQ